MFYFAGARNGRLIKTINSQTARRPAEQKINTYHVGLMPYLLDRLKQIPDGDGTVDSYTPGPAPTDPCLPTSPDFVKTITASGRDTAMLKPRNTVNASDAGTANASA